MEIFDWSAIQSNADKLRKENSKTHLFAFLLASLCIIIFTDPSGRQVSKEAKSRVHGFKEEML